MYPNKGVVGTLGAAMPTDWRHPGIVIIDETYLRKAGEPRFLLGEKNMADSNITKHALSAALKELMDEKPFEKISVSDICERCHMNRKSFYYHFRDKYDLANWIFDMDLLELTRSNSIEITDPSRSFYERWAGIAVFCRYFYDNRAFYRNVMRVEGQNSFAEHFRSFLYPPLRLRVEEQLGSKEVPQMVYDIVVDGIVCAFERWMLDKNCISAEEFVKNLYTLLNLLVTGVTRDTKE